MPPAVRHPSIWLPWHSLVKRPDVWGPGQALCTAGCRWLRAPSPTACTLSAAGGLQLRGPAAEQAGCRWLRAPSPTACTLSAAGGLQLRGPAAEQTTVRACVCVALEAQSLTLEPWLPQEAHSCVDPLLSDHQPVHVNA